MESTKQITNELIAKVLASVFPKEREDRKEK